jgi:hypothetical protein
MYMKINVLCERKEKREKSLKTKEYMDSRIASFPKTLLYCWYKV